VGSINSSGLFTAANTALAGTYSNEVTASAGGIGGSATVNINVGALSKIVVSPNPGSTVPGGTINFSAVAEDIAGNPLAVQPTFTWTNAHAAVGSISAGGVFAAANTALAGSYSNEVTASAGGVSGSATVNINVGSFSKIVVSPNPGATVPGGTINFSAVAEDIAGNPLAVQPTFTWTNAHALVGSINASGVFTAANTALAGSYLNEVTASAGGVSGSATVVINAGSLSQIVVSPNPGTTVPSGTINFSAVAEDIAGNPLAVQPTFTWTNSHASVGSINTSGVFTAANTVLAGSYSNEVTASASGVSGSATVVINAGSLSKIVVSPNPGSTVPAGTISFSAQAQDIAGNPLTVQPTFTWTNAHATVGSINSSGLFTAANTALAGTYSNEVTASAGGIGGSATVNINVGALSKIVVSPNPGSTVPGGTINFSAVAEDIAGNPLAVQPTFTWTNAHAAVGSINASGIFTAANTVLAGTYSNEVTASAGGVSGLATININVGSFAKIIVSPNPGTTNPFGTISFMAVAQDIAGNPLAVQPSFSWAASAGGTINSGSGLFSAGNTANTFTNAVTALANGITGSATVIVNAFDPTLTSITPSSATLGGPGFTMTVIGTNFVTNSLVRWNGNTLLTTYVSPTQLTAQVDAFRIAASGPVSVTVKNPDPAGESNALPFIIRVLTKIIVEPDGKTIQLSDLLNFTATAYDQDGQVMQDITSYAWGINGNGAASISNQGSFRTLSDVAIGQQYTISAKSSSVTGFAHVVIASPFASSNCGAYAYPVPWKSNMGVADITFTGLSAATKIRIFSIDGRIVKTLYSQYGENALWDIHNDNGDKVASGVYIYLIDSPGPCGKKDGKVVVIK